MAAKTRGTPPTTKAAGSVKRPSAVAKSKSPASVDSKPEVRIFVSYSHVDVEAQAKLNTHLAPWRRDGVKVWYDENIEPGAELDAEIARELRQAHIFVALFSPAYLDSNYCWNIEYKRAMGRRARKLMRVVAVVVKPCGWKQTPAAGFKLLPKDGIPPERWSSKDAAYVNVAQGIGEVIKSVRRELLAKSPKPSRAMPKPGSNKSAAAKKIVPTPTVKPRSVTRNSSK
ncbi:toll/interleukin-1 receptor domain-containing protein [Rubellimicrobium rubrum]|uniref:Toll/interleukin-1 receptor domain-containing protein n=1 Tax=Rubellimicrobium rubrum TaxID=2585369 RepID=A0A5C4MR06_9RHOB|nr:toll/interleukin-1 receptor domain-containing protein [Rubellimicrobium rubrum]TNC46501.1 toll/interleukin-1 receptor domain-containing protein [Rubellimicrobium rubrum]